MAKFYRTIEEFLVYRFDGKNFQQKGTIYVNRRKILLCFIFSLKKDAFLSFVLVVEIYWYENNLLESNCILCSTQKICLNANWRKK